MVEVWMCSVKGRLSKIQRGNQCLNTTGVSLLKFSRVLPRTSVLGQNTAQPLRQQGERQGCSSCPSWDLLDSWHGNSWSLHLWCILYPAPLQVGGRFLVATCTRVQPEPPVGVVLSPGRRHCPLLGDAFQACVSVIHSNVAVERQENISFQTS